MPFRHSERGREALLAIRENAQRAGAVRARNTSASFAANWQDTYIAIHCLEIVSEAARRLAPEVVERHPDLPWRQIRDIGNLLRHGYDAILPERIWAILDHDLATLLAAVDGELG